jgi:galactose oxidase
VKKTFKSAIAVTVAVVAALAMTGVNSLPAKADGTFISQWFTQGTGDCLGVYGGNMTNGTPVVQWPCNGNPDQTWEIQTVNGPPMNDGYTLTWTQVVNYQDPSKCLGVLGGAIGDGAPLVIWDCNGHTDQRWLFSVMLTPTPGVPDGCYSVTDRNTWTKVVGVFGASTAPGAQVVLWDGFTPPHPDQVWCSTIGVSGGVL